MTPEQLAALDAIATSAPAEIPAEVAPGEAWDPKPLAAGRGASDEQPCDDWCCLRAESRKHEIRFVWEAADGAHASDWKPRERSNTALALFVGFLKSFVMKQHGRVPSDRSHLDKSADAK